MTHPRMMASDVEIRQQMAAGLPCECSSCFIALSAVGTRTTFGTCSDVVFGMCLAGHLLIYMRLNHLERVESSTIFLSASSNFYFATRFVLQ